MVQIVSKTILFAFRGDFVFSTCNQKRIRHERFTSVSLTARSLSWSVGRRSPHWIRLKINWIGSTVCTWTHRYYIIVRISKIVPERNRLIHYFWRCGEKPISKILSTRLSSKPTLSTMTFNLRKVILRFDLCSKALLTIGMLMNAVGAVAGARYAQCKRTTSRFAGTRNFYYEHFFFCRQWNKWRWCVRFICDKKANFFAYRQLSDLTDII